MNVVPLCFNAVIHIMSILQSCYTRQDLGIARQAEIISVDITQRTI